MAVNNSLRLFLVLYQCALALLTVIDPQNLGDGVFTHCLGNGDVIQLKDPFPPAAANDSFLIAVEWYHYPKDRSNQTELFIFVKSPKPYSTIYNTKYSTFEFWGLQIDNPGLDDTGIYMAKLTSLRDNEERTFSIDVASPPGLESDKLSITRGINQQDHAVTLSCGKVSSLGTPPISITMKAGNGTTLPTVYNEGYFQLTVTPQEDESGIFTCEVNMTAPAAQCISSKDLPRWQGAAIGKISTAEMNVWTIFGIVAGVIAAITVIITVFVLVVLRRRSKARKAEETNSSDLNSNKSRPLLRDDEVHYDRPSINRTPIYKGPNSPGPYMVSKVSQDDDPNYHDPNYQDQNYQDQNYHDPDAEYEEINCENNGRPSSRPNSSSFFKKREDKRKPESGGVREKGNGREKDGQAPPRVKPRSIFLTPSMEELDKISKAVAGGEGSRSGAIGTQV